jgi:hypothetical protein
MRKFITGYLIAAFMIAALLAGCVSAATAADGWTTRQDPHGFALDVPPGWALAYDAVHRAAQVSGSDGTRVVIRVVTTKAAVGQSDGAAEGAMLAKQTDAAVAWPAPHLVSPVIATFDATTGTGRSGKAYFTWVSSPAMSIGYLYEASGGPAAFANDRAIVTRVFSSYRILRAQPAAGASVAAAQYQTFAEPQEHMYTVDLPAGWTRMGGAYRKSALDVRPAFRAAQSGAMIASGDPNIPFFAIPNRMTAMGNLREGSWYDAGPGVRLMLRRYTDGTTFAQQYARANFGAPCANFQLANVRARQDAVAQLDALYARLGLSTQLTAGEAAFTCTRSGAAMQGYVFAATQQETTSGMGMWSVPVLLAYFATPERSASAHAALDRAVGTYHIDDAWAARNIQTAQKISEITTSTGHAISKIISDTYWSKTESENRTFEKLDDAARGVQNAIDPRTNEPIKIDDRYEYNFISPYGKILGSDVDALPGPQFQRILLTQ